MMLTAQNLTIARAGLPVLEGVSFAIGAGQALILRGPNGIGKTTLLRALAGLAPPLFGHIAVAEDAVAYAAHADGVKSTLTVAENLRFWAAVYGGGDIATALAAMNLEALANRPAGQLSAGQKRRLGLARLHVTHRPIWVLDEPTISLDSASTALFAGQITRHLAAGGAAIIATHIDLGFAAQVLDLTPFRAKNPQTRGFEEAFL